MNTEPFLSGIRFLPLTPQYLVLQSTITIRSQLWGREHVSFSLSEQNTSIDQAAVFLFLLSPSTPALQGQELSGPRIL